MATFIRVYQSSFLYQVQIMKGKLEANGIQCFIKNEFVNNVATMPFDQGYILIVDEKDAERAHSIIEEDEDLE